MRYAKTLASNGIAALVVDSFGSRDVKSTIGKQSIVSAQSMTLDAFAALSFLAAHPRIDAERIAIIGWSKGGVVADLTAREWYRHRIVDDERHFAAHVAFYPWCGDQESKIELTGAPVLYLVGGRDDWSGVQPCVDYADRMVDAGYDARIVVYEEALHAFDYEGSFKRHLPHALSWTNCAYFSHVDGFIVAATGRFYPWSKLDRYFEQCAVPGAHIGTHATARSQAMDTLLEFLRVTLAPSNLARTP
jgi:dienelactone hydrolase